MSSHHMTASLAAAHIDTLLAEAQQHRLVSEVRRGTRKQQEETFEERPRRRWFPRLATT
jgi:hypothetical protein